MTLVSSLAFFLSKALVIVPRAMPASTMTAFRSGSSNSLRISLTARGLVAKRLLIRLKALRLPSCSAAVSPSHSRSSCVGDAGSILVGEVIVLG